MRVRTSSQFTCLILFLGFGPACFSPTFPNGVLCTIDGRCPGDQTCAADNRCYDPGDEPGGSPDTALSALSVSAGSLVPDFDPLVLDYTLDLGLRDPKLRVTAASRSQDATLEINGVSVASGQPGPVATLSFSENQISIKVAATDAADTMYTISVRRGVNIEHRAYIKASNTDAGDTFGSVAIDGDLLVVGALREDANSGLNGNQSDNSAVDAGAAYVFVRSVEGNWEQQAYLKPIQTIDSLDQFGTSVAISGDTIVVGSPGEDSNAVGVNSGGGGSNNNSNGSGAAFVFVRNGQQWTQQAYLKPTNTGMLDGFGQDVAISGNTIVVGAPGEDSNGRGVNSGRESDDTVLDSGAAFVFTRVGTTWAQQAYIKASNADERDRLGRSVDVDDQTIVVGASGEQSFSNGVDGDESDNSGNSVGAAYVFERTGSSWSQTTYLKASSPDSGDFFSNVSVSGDSLAVSAVGEDSSSAGIDGNPFDNSLLGAGAVYVFVRNGNSWTQQAYLKASLPGETDFLGRAVIAGDMLIAGASGERSAATGLDGDEADNSLEEAGAAYLFVRRENVWSQLAYIKPSNTDRLDNATEYGLDLSLEGTIVFGSSDASIATGIDGDQSDNSASQAGAVYAVD